jgi:hypothetical protein
VIHAFVILIVHLLVVLKTIFITNSFHMLCMLVGRGRGVLGLGRVTSHLNSFILWQFNETDQTRSEQSVRNHVERSCRRRNGSTISAFCGGGGGIEKNKKPGSRWPTTLLRFEPETPPSCPQCVMFVFTQTCCFYSDSKTRTSPGQGEPRAPSLSITANRVSCHTFCRGMSEWLYMHTHTRPVQMFVKDSCQSVPSRPHSPPPQL